jgi:hypothetical protein
VAEIGDERAAFDRLADALRGSAAVTARALVTYRGRLAENAVRDHFDHTLDRIAAMYGRGTYEALTTAGIADAAIGKELRLAAALAGAHSDGPTVTAARARARSLVGVARRGVRLHVREQGDPPPLRHGVYVQPLREDVEHLLWANEEPYARWRDGALLIRDEDEIAALREQGDEVTVLFLDPDELLDLAGREEPERRAAFEAAFDRRLAIARASADGVGDSRDRYVVRLLFDQTVVLRNLRDRLADGHPFAYEEILPIVAEHTDLLAARLATEPVADATLRDPLGASIAAERDIQALVRRWAAEPADPAGLRERFRVVADAGTRLAELERHHP